MLVSIDSIAKINTNKHPAPIPGIVKGKYTFQKATNGVPPKDYPALIKLGDIVFITLYKGKTINGNNICVIAT